MESNTIETAAMAQARRRSGGMEGRGCVVRGRKEDNDEEYPGFL